MLNQYQESLEEMKERMRLHVKWNDHKIRAENYLHEEQQKMQKLKYRVEQERTDVEQFEKLSFTNLFYTIVGRKLEKMEKEQQELLQAQLKYDEAVATINDLQKEMTEIEKILLPLGQPKEEHEQLLQEKKALLLSMDSVESEQISSLLEKGAELKAQANEFDEAIVAGENAKQALNVAIASLESASGWSTWDIFGGGMISTAIKHSHIDDAKANIHEAQRALRHFEEELRDVNAYTDFKIEMSGFLTFADYFFDGFIVDWMVHGKINDSLRQTTDMLEDIRGLLTTLRQQQSDLQESIEANKRERIDLIERA